MISRIYYKEGEGIVQGSRRYYIPVRFPYKSKKELLQDISGCNRDPIAIKKKILKKISENGFKEIVYLIFIPNRKWKKRVTLHDVRETLYHIKKLTTITVNWIGQFGNNKTTTQHRLGSLIFEGLMEKRLIDLKKLSSYKVAPITFNIPCGFKAVDMWIEEENRDDIILIDSIRFILELWEIWKG